MKNVIPTKTTFAQEKEQMVVFVLSIILVLLSVLAFAWFVL